MVNGRTERGTVMRLIDASVLQEEYKKRHDGKRLLLIDVAPTVDAVPVVRCKDCLHNRACEIQYHAQAGDLFFCGAAERKDGEAHD